MIVIAFDDYDEFITCKDCGNKTSIWHGKALIVFDKVIKLKKVI